MKALLYLCTGLLLVSFTSKKTGDDIDGIWMGYYRSSLVKEKLIIKLSDVDKMEFYTGGVDDRTRSEGSYRLLGDSVSFTCRTPEGTQILMQGHVNYRKDFVEGTWKGADNAGGRFFLEKQDLEERTVQP